MALREVRVARRIAQVISVVVSAGLLALIGALPVHARTRGDVRVAAALSPLDVASASNRLRGWILAEAREFLGITDEVEVLLIGQEQTDPAPSSTTRSLYALATPGEQAALGSRLPATASVNESDGRVVIDLFPSIATSAIPNGVEQSVSGRRITLRLSADAVIRSRSTEAIRQALAVARAPSSNGSSVANSSPLEVTCINTINDPQLGSDYALYVRTFGSVICDAPGTTVYTLSLLAYLGGGLVSYNVKNQLMQPGPFGWAVLNETKYYCGVITTGDNWWGSTNAAFYIPAFNPFSIAVHSPHTPYYWCNR